MLGLFGGWPARAVATVGSAQHIMALSASDQAPVEQRFERLDNNHNGLVAWEEAMLSRARDFDSMDKNDDRRITKAEFLATHRSMFMQFDGDANQRISMSEFATAQSAAANQAIMNSP